MWVAFALGSAFFAGLVAILAKVGIRATSSNVATAIRTVVVLAMSWLMVFVVGSLVTISSISTRSLVFLVLSGLATGASWLCYFHALQLGPVNEVAAVDKSSIVLTVLLGIIVFGETSHLAVRLVGIGVIAAGTVLMVEWKPGGAAPVSRSWLVYACLAAVFASLTSILAKVGITDVESTLGTAIRTMVVLVMAWVLVLVTRERHRVREIPRRDLLFICLSGVATGASWLCFYRALQTGPVSAVVPIDKLSLVVTVAFAYAVFGERLSRRGLTGLMLIVVGTVAMVV